MYTQNRTHNTFTFFSAEYAVKNKCAPENRLSSYTYGFNGKENDGETNTYDYGFRIYNARIGKFLSVDPLTRSYPWYTPYQFAGNKPIACVDLDGLEETSATSWHRNLAHSALQSADIESEAGNALLGVYLGMQVGGIGLVEGVINFGFNPGGAVYDMTTNYYQNVWYGSPETQVLYLQTGPIFAPHIQGFNTAWEKDDYIGMGEFGTYLAADALMFVDGVRVSVRKIGSGTPESPSSYAVDVVLDDGVVRVKNTSPQVGSNFKSYNPTISGGKINIPGRAVTNGNFDYIITNDGQLRIGSGHYYMSDGATTVKAAGQMKIYNGQVKSINNSSGHYQPSAIEAQNAINLLKDMGVDLSKAKIKTYDPNGNLIK